jgi:hypothetical protein
MAGFTFLGGPPAIDPNSLPALLHRPPGLIPGPIQAPQLGQSPGFRPPPMMGAPQMPSMPGMRMPQQQTPGFGVQQGAEMLRAGLAGWKPSVTAVGPQGGGPGGAYTPADAAAMAAGAGLDINGSTVDPELVAWNQAQSPIGTPGMNSDPSGFSRVMNYIGGLF